MFYKLTFVSLSAVFPVGLRPSILLDFRVCAFSGFFSSHFCLPVCSCRVFHSAGCKVVLFTKLLFNDLRFFAGYWFWAIARFVVFLLRPDKICDSGLFPFTVTLPESHSLLTCSNQRSIVTETLYRCYIVLQLNYLRINILQLIFGFSVLLLFCIAFVMLQVFCLSAFGLLCISFSNFYRLLFTAFHRLLFPWACISGFYNFTWVDLLSLLP